MGQRLTPTDDAGRARWLTRLAFVLSAAIVLARATMLETVRNPLDVYPGSEAGPRGPGAGTGAALDLLGCAPALLVLARRSFDPTYGLRFAWSFVPLGGLAMWTIASVLWAGDRFAAAVSGFHWFSATVLLWSTAQLVRDWKHLRLVAAVAFGLLLVQLGEGFYKKYVEYPELKAQFEKTKDEFLRQRGWEPGSFHALQFERRVASGEIMGFTSSENSYGALVVLLTAVATGVLIQRLSDRDAPGWPAAAAVGVAAALVMIAHLRSRTAYATPLLGAAALAGVWVLRGWLGRHPRRAFGMGLGAVLLALAAVVGHGVHHGSLPGDSLAFRWRYWTASARLFARHPVVGVGWDNFGLHYLSVRLPVAAEEIKDPHNFIVRFATELGSVGLMLLAVALAWLWYDLTVGRTADTAHDERLPDLKIIGPGAREVSPSASAALQTLVAIGAGGMALNALASVDWAQTFTFVALELMRRIGLLCLFLVGAAAVALRSMERQELDERPAPWVLYGTLVGLGLFLVHNLVDFSLFEPGPMALFMFLCGAAMGIRLPTPDTGPGGPGGARAAFITGILLWLATTVAFAVPVIIAERAADDGDEALRSRQVDRAATDFERALAAVPYNADYAYRAGRALLFADDPRRRVDRVIPLLERAAAINPYRPEYWLSRADSEVLRPAPDLARIRAGYDRALALDPNSVQVRLDYAAILQRLGDRTGAREQYEAALRYNDLLSPDEPKRLPAAKVAEVRQAIAELGRAT